MQERSKDFSLWLAGCQLLAVLWAIPVAFAALVLLAVADTGQGRCFAGAALLLAAVPFAAARAWATGGKRWLRGSLAGTALFALLFWGLAVRPPRIDGAQTGRVTSQFTGSAGVILRYSPINFIPEGDQLLFEFTVAALVDPLLTLGQAARLRAMTAPLYREQAADADFAQLGSVLPETHADLLGFRPESGHVYVYRPAGLDPRKPAPVLVFFHGAGGNFKAYLWILSKAADRLGFVLVAPSHGMGVWREAASVAALESALTAAGRVVLVDRERVHLAGLSNGGLAVSQLASVQGERFQSLVFISPVFDQRALGSPDFARHNRGRSILTITGARDDRVSLGYVEDQVSRLERAGAKVELQTVADADHFLIFTHRERFVQALGDWLAGR